MTAKNDEKHCHPERSRRRSEGSHRGIIALRSGYTMRFFIPLRSIQNDSENAALHRNDNEEAMKRIVISNEPIGDVRDLDV
jgi:hypothetical protein